MTDVWRGDFSATPPFAHLRTWAKDLAGDDWPALARLNHLAATASLINAHGMPIRFQTQERRCGQRDYEAGILATGEVPTRENNWHDLLNALTWLAFPRAKAALNQVQCQSLGLGRARGPVSDAATLFDESGLILAGPDESLGHLLADRQWGRAFVEHRPAWREVRAYVIGHAVLEKLLAPWPGITAKCLFVRMETPADESSYATAADETVAEIWRSGAITQPAELFPLPVLGIPGWWPANENPDFYANRNVFRPARN
jgi:hypothetical protein